MACKQKGGKYEFCCRQGLRIYYLYEKARSRSIELIEKIRTTPAVKGRGKPRVVRRFVKPHINMAATTYTEMVNLKEIQVYEPPITIGLPMELLEKCLDDSKEVISFF